MSRTHGEGTIVQRKDGRWQASLMVGGVRRTAYALSRREAVAKLAELKRQATAGLPDPGRRTVADLLDAWLKAAEPNLRPKTVEGYRHICAKHVVPALGNVRLSQLEPALVEAFVAKLQASGRRRTAQRVFAVLHRACSFAVRWRWLAENPMDRVQRPQWQPGERRLWGAEQASVFLKAVLAGEGGQYACLLGFLLASGCRIGEALGLRWADVDFVSGTIHIERQITQVRGKPIEGRPKTQSGIRTIALPAWGVELLRRQKAQVNEWRLQSGHAHDWPGRVFPTCTGTVPLQGNIRRALRELSRKLGLPAVTPHSLRHISLSLLAGAGVPLKDLQRRAGHATARMTLDVYLHALAEGDRRAADALEALVK